MGGGSGVLGVRYIEGRGRSLGSRGDKPRGGEDWGPQYMIPQGWWVW